ncbi:uncharacterized protein [Dermacentor albipictus]|uniref:uncharacterized protein n=1 Tax=Dermacentor albipictus TaxID=60249 RepID=UPI0038FC8E5A
MVRHSLVVQRTKRPAAAGITLGATATPALGALVSALLGTIVGPSVGLVRAISAKFAFALCVCFDKMPGGKCKFQSAWLQHTDYRHWVRPEPSDPYRAKCAICQKTVDIATMGESALKSHQKGAKHRSKTAAGEGCSSVASLVQARNLTSAAPLGTATTATSSRAATLEEDCRKHDSVIEAEILWTMKVVSSHYSYSSSGSISQLFQKMFPDSEVARSFTCSEKKCAYVACHGLRPFFTSQVQQMMEKSDNLVVLFDETLNEYLQRKQLDVHVRLWNNCEVATRYPTSTFMGHSTADDLMQKLTETLASFPLSKIVQLSMDGPNVNWSLFNKLQQHMKNDFQVQCLDIGSCGLHTVHNAYKAGMHATSWPVDTFLSSLFSLFHDAPARREDFVEETRSKLFPLPFVPHRWVENVPVLERALAMWEHLRHYTEAVSEHRLPLPKCRAYENVSDFLKDQLALAKLNFSLNIAMVVQPFLTVFQSDSPKTFFLAKELETVLRSLLAKFMKRSVLTEATSITKLLRIDVHDTANYTSLEKVDVGRVAEKILKSGKASTKCVFEFRGECRKFIVNMILKIMERSPIRYPLVRGLLCFDPREMSKTEMCLGKLKVVLYCLIDSKLLSEHKSDIVCAQYIQFCQEKRHELQNYERDQERLDVLFVRLLKHDPAFSMLWEVLKVLLLLSHGQASVERGFSVNKQIAVENMAELSYISQRVICEAVKTHGGLLNVPLSKELKSSVRQARHRYALYMDEQKKQAVAQQVTLKRKELELELQSMQEKKTKLQKTLKCLQESADRFSEDAEAKNDLTCLVKANSFRRTAKKKKEAEITALEREINAKIGLLS